MKNSIRLLKPLLMACLLCNIFLSGNLLMAQGLDFTKNKDLHQIAEATDTPGWINFKANVYPDNIFELHRNAFNLTKQDHMQLMKTEKDNLGFTHYRFQQMHNDLEVEGAQFFVHAKDGKAVKGNGTIITEIKTKEKASITPSNAIEIAKAYLPAEVYMWEDIEEEDRLKELRKDLFASYTPVARLMYSYTERNGIMDQSSFALTYRVEIHAKKPHDSQAIYIDAQTGEIRKSIPLEHHCFNGAGCTLYNGAQGIQTDRTFSSIHALFDDCRGNGIHTRRFPSASILNWGNNWFNANLCEGVSTHWAMARTYDYFSNSHGRNSYNNAGATINSFIQNNGFGPDNAFWSTTAQTQFRFWWWSAYQWSFSKFRYCRSRIYTCRNSIFCRLNLLWRIWLPE